MGDIRVNELLCFVQNRINMLDVKMLKSLCTKTYSSDEISCSKDAVKSICDEKNVVFENRIINRTGKDKDNKNIDDIILMFQKLGTDCPTFVAANLNKLPPVYLENIDVCTLLDKITLLTAAVEFNAEEIKTLKSSTVPQSGKGPNRHQSKVGQIQTDDVTNMQASGIHNASQWSRGPPNPRSLPPQQVFTREQVPKAGLNLPLRPTAASFWPELSSNESPWENWVEIGPNGKPKKPKKPTTPARTSTQEARRKFVVTGTDSKSTVKGSDLRYLLL